MIRKRIHLALSTALAVTGLALIPSGAGAEPAVAPAPVEVPESVNMRPDLPTTLEERIELGTAETVHFVHYFACNTYNGHHRLTEIYKTRDDGAVVKDWFLDILRQQANGQWYTFQANAFYGQSPGHMHIADVVFSHIPEGEACDFNIVPFPGYPYDRAGLCIDSWSGDTWFRENTGVGRWFSGTPSGPGSYCWGSWAENSSLVALSAPQGYQRTWDPQRWYFHTTIRGR